MIGAAVNRLIGDRLIDVTGGKPQARSLSSSVYRFESLMAELSLTYDSAAVVEDELMASSQNGSWP